MQSKSDVPIKRNFSTRKRPHSRYLLWPRYAPLFAVFFSLSGTGSRADADLRRPWSVNATLVEVAFLDQRADLRVDHVAL